MTVAAVQGSTGTNPDNAMDVNADGFVSAIDVLMVINHLNTVGSGDAPVGSPYLDTSGDGFVSALDVLVVINAVNTGGAGEGEAERALVAVDELMSVFGDDDEDEIWNGLGSVI